MPCNQVTVYDDYWVMIDISDDFDVLKSSIVEVRYSYLPAVSSITESGTEYLYTAKSGQARFDQKLSLYANDIVDKQLKIWIKEKSLTFPRPAHLSFSSLYVIEGHGAVRVSSVR